MNSFIGTKKNLESIFTSSVLGSFSKEKILKSLKRFGITVSEPELTELLENSYSIEKAEKEIIEKYHPKPLVVSNLSNFIARYWELLFPDKWSAEMVIDMMLDPDFSFVPENYLDQFEEHIGLFKHIKELQESLEQLQESDLKTQFEKALLYWVPRMVNVYQEIEDYSDYAVDIFEELSEFIQNKYLKRKLKTIKNTIY